MTRSSNNPRAVIWDLDGTLSDDRARAHFVEVEEGRQRDWESYFDAIDADASQLLLALEAPDGAIVGTMQLTFIPGLSRGGATRMQIEAVRIDEALRGAGLGGAMIEWAIGHARERGARLVQLTSDARRDDAHRFYERLGFEASHVGFKRDL